MVKSQNTSNESDQAVRPQRQISVDVYRGMVMFLMLFEAVHIYQLAKRFPDSQLCQWLKFHTTHVAWEGCSLHDMIQPSFTFLVGVAMPFSIASRIQKGKSTSRLLLHAAWRSLLLICIGIFLRSMDSDRTSFRFDDTLTQIGMGYFFVFLIALAPRWVHYTSIVLILAGFWAAFAMSPEPPADFDYPAVGVSADWAHHHEGFASRWNKNSNLSWQTDVWFMNLFPRDTPFEYSSGGYSTLSFVPTMATMLIGLLAGVWLKQPIGNGGRLSRLVIAAAVGIGVGWLLGWSDVCPLVKRIWTPSFTLYSGGWCMLWLAALYVICDIGRFHKWAFPFIVIGSNSILIYIMSWTVESPIRDALFRHFGKDTFAIGGEYTITPLSGVCTLLIMFAVLLWLYRRKVFVRI